MVKISHSSFDMGQMYMPDPTPKTNSFVSTHTKKTNILNNRK